MMHPGQSMTPLTFIDRLTLTRILRHAERELTGPFGTRARTQEAALARKLIDAHDHEALAAGELSHRLIRAIRAGDRDESHHHRLTRNLITHAETFTPTPNAPPDSEWTHDHHCPCDECEHAAAAEADAHDDWSAGRLP